MQEQSVELGANVAAAYILAGLGQIRLSISYNAKASSDVQEAKRRHQLPVVSDDDRSCVAGLRKMVAFSQSLPALTPPPLRRGSRMLWNLRQLILNWTPEKMMLFTECATSLRS